MEKKNYTIQSAMTFIFVSYLFSMITINFWILGMIEAILSGGFLVFGLYLLKDKTKNLKIAFYLSIIRCIFIAIDVVRSFIMPMELPTFIIILNLFLYFVLTLMVIHETTKICTNVKASHLYITYICFFISGILFYGDNVSLVIWIPFFILIIYFLNGLFQMRKAPEAKQSIEVVGRTPFSIIYSVIIIIICVMSLSIHYFWPMVTYENYEYQIDMNNKELVYTINDFASFWDFAKMYKDKNKKESYILHLHKENNKEYTLIDMRFDFPDDLFAAHVYPRVYDGENFYITNEEQQSVDSDFVFFGDVTNTIYRTYCNPNAKDLDVYLELYLAPYSDDNGEPVINLEDVQFFMGWSVYSRNTFNYALDASQYGERIDLKGAVTK